nr:MarR family transcriptional regulator [uncultured Mucilaginibacter sp.]
MNLYQSLGYLVLGSRLRRMSETFLAEINRIYQNEGIEFEASWFPVFYLLSKNESLSIKELSDQTEVSHPAASQLIASLKNKGMVETSVCTDDGRRQLVQFTKKGRSVLNQILPIWEAINNSMMELAESDAAAMQLLPAISAMENVFRSANFVDSVSEKLNVKAINHG